MSVRCLLWISELHSCSNVFSIHPWYVFQIIILRLLLVRKNNYGSDWGFTYMVENIILIIYIHFFKSLFTPKAFNSKGVVMLTYDWAQHWQQTVADSHTGNNAASFFFVVWVLIYSEESALSYGEFGIPNQEKICFSCPQKFNLEDKRNNRGLICSQDYFMPP